MLTPIDTMDVSAFEADTGDPLTWSEAYERLPEGVRIPVSSVQNWL
jgi:hypothetical protein